MEVSLSTSLGLLFTQTCSFSVPMVSILSKCPGVLVGWVLHQLLGWLPVRLKPLCVSGMLGGMGTPQGWLMLRGATQGGLRRGPSKGCTQKNLRLGKHWDAAGNLVSNTCRADSRSAPTQWEMSLQSNSVSHWLGTNLDSALTWMMWTVGRTHWLVWLWFYKLVFKEDTRAHFLSLPQSKLRLCSANHRAGYFSNLAGDWLSIVWA